MASEHGPQKPQRDQPSAVPEADAAIRGRQAQVTPVIDPLALSEERARRDEATRQFEARSRQRIRTAAGWLLASVLMLAVFTILNQAAGLSGWLVAVSVAAVIASAGAAVRARQLRRARPTVRPDAVLGREQAVQPTDLDPLCRALLGRAQHSIAETVPLLERLEGEIDRPAAEAGLAESEWALARFLRDLTRARARYDAVPEDRRDSSRRTLEKAQGEAEGLVGELEAYTARLRAAAGRHPDAGGVRRTSDGLLDLAVSTETALKAATQQIRELTQAAAELENRADSYAGEVNGHPEA